MVKRKKLGALRNLKRIGCMSSLPVCSLRPPGAPGAMHSLIRAAQNSCGTDGIYFGRSCLAQAKQLDFRWLTVARLGGSGDLRELALSEIAREVNIPRRLGGFADLRELADNAGPVRGELLNRGELSNRGELCSGKGARKVKRQQDCQPLHSPLAHLSRKRRKRRKGGRSVPTAFSASPWSFSPANRSRKTRFPAFCQGMFGPLWGQKYRWLVLRFSARVPGRSVLVAGESAPGWPGWRTCRAGRRRWRNSGCGPACVDPDRGATPDRGLRRPARSAAD